MFLKSKVGLARTRRQLSVDDDDDDGEDDAKDSCTVAVEATEERHQSTSLRPALPTPLHRPSPPLPRPSADRRQEKRKTVLVLSRRSFSADAPTSPRCVVVRSKRSSPRKTDDLRDDEKPRSERTKTPVDSTHAASAANTHPTQARGQDSSCAVRGASAGRWQQQQQKQQRLSLKDTGVRSSSSLGGGTVHRFQYDYVQLVPGRQRTDSRQDRSDLKRSFDEGVVYLSTDDFLGTDCHETDIGQAVAVERKLGILPSQAVTIFDGGGVCQLLG